MVSKTAGKIIIRLDADHQRGMGHLYRMMELASVLRCNAIDPVFIIRKNQVSENMLKDRDFVYYAFDVKLTEVEIIREAIKLFQQVHLWIYDVLDTEAEWINLLKYHHCSVLSIDDVGSGMLLADKVILMLPVKFVALESHNHNENVLAGLEYLILNEKLKNFRRTRELDKDTAGYVVGVTMGGSDTYGSTVIIAKALKAVSEDIKVIHFFLGPSFQHQEKLKEILSGINYDYQLHYWESCLHQQLDGMDIVICGGGMTLFEVSAMGLPVLGFANEYFEQDNISHIAMRGGCVSLGCVHRTALNEIQQILLQNLLQKERLNILGVKARKLINLDGTKLVANSIFELMGSKE